MAVHSADFNKNYNLTKYHFLAIGLWPYETKKFSKFLKYLWPVQNFIALILLVSIKITKLLKIYFLENITLLDYQLTSFFLSGFYVFVLDSFITNIFIPIL